MTDAEGQRILTLDVVRGVAVMGILLLNIIGFAMPAPAYFNPVAYGEASGVDLFAWFAAFVLFDGKMRGLFSFLFGASILLLAERTSEKGGHPALAHYSRMTWLLVFGLLHLWLVWWGDILHSYALVGLVAFLFRGAPPMQLVVGGVMLLAVQLAIVATIGWSASIPAMQNELAKIFGRPSMDWLADQVALHRSGWLEIAVARFRDTQWMPVDGLIQNGAETLAYMLFGMAALKSGMLTGAWSRATLRRWTIIGFGGAMSVYIGLAIWMMSRDFDLRVVVTAIMPATVPIRPLMVMGWASLIVLLMRPGGMMAMRLAAAGRMAFTNYLLSSLICTTIFYGYGLGWYGALSRAQCYLVVAALWCGMLIWSKPWLERFGQGPSERGWRVLAAGPAKWRNRKTVANGTQ
jgi:uncharacterized protein